MATCPNNHESRTNDFCSVCGIEMSATTEVAPVTEPKIVAGVTETCPICRHHGQVMEAISAKSAATISKRARSPRFRLLRNPNPRNRGLAAGKKRKRLPLEERSWQHSRNRPNQSR